MKRLPFALTIAAILLAVPLEGFAEDAPPAPAEPTPEWTFPASVDITTDYIFRGLTQTKKDPALQAGIEVDHASVFYVGV